MPSSRAGLYRSVYPHAPAICAYAQVCTIAVSPDGSLLLSVDEDGRGLLINRQRNALLHHFSFKGRVAVAKFSPDGAYLAVGVGRLVQVWHTPSKEKQLSPWALHRTYGQCHSDVLDLDWTPDSQFIAVASKDITLRCAWACMGCMGVWRCVHPATARSTCTGVCTRHSHGESSSAVAVASAWVLHAPSHKPYGCCMRPQSHIPSWYGMLLAACAGSCR